MNLEEIYTSTGGKLLHYPKEIEQFKNYGIASSINLQIAPTSNCNLNCSFCSNRNRSKGENLSPETIFNLLSRLGRLRGVEWTGGGEPLLYPYINEVMKNANDNMLSQGLITNGTSFDKLNHQNLHRLKWIRISMNCLDYVKEIDIPEFYGTLGFSYVIDKGFESLGIKERKEKILEIKSRLDPYVTRYEARYVRIVPDCQTDKEKQEQNNEIYSKIIGELGKPYFYQAKKFMKPERCWWCYFKPFVLHDGWVYPCSSVVLNNDAEQKFHEKYRWVKADLLVNMYLKMSFPFSTENCEHCVFWKQNSELDDLYLPNEMVDFI